jgi:hypothetical protein
MSSSVTLLNNRPDLHAAPYLDEDRRILTVSEIAAVNEYMDELERRLVEIVNYASSVNIVGDPYGRFVNDRLKEIARGL